jgi:hypothetical protein
MYILRKEDIKHTFQMDEKINKKEVVLVKGVNDYDDNSVYKSVNYKNTQCLNK